MRLFLWPFLLFGGLLKFLIVIAIVILIVRLVTHRGHYAGHWHGHMHGGWAPENQDPRRIAAMRYASGQIDRAEFDRIMSTLDATAPGATTPPQAPMPPQA